MSQTTQKKINVALDGPAGSGKSTVAQRIASLLGYTYVDTGAMYRAMTLAFLRANMPIADVVSPAFVRQQRITWTTSDGGRQVFLNGEEVTEAIRSIAVTNHVTAVAALLEVRHHLVHEQRFLARDGGIVMDGRDIGTHVLPDAAVKIYLTASVEVRARRRYAQWIQTNPSLTLDDLIASITLRDHQDQTRTHAPLVCAPDAVVIDSSDLDITDVVHRIVTQCTAVIGSVTSSHDL